MKNLLASLLAAASALAVLAYHPAAHAAACVSGTVANYEALGATGCSVDGVTFSNMHVSTLGAVTTGDFSPFAKTVGGSTEFGLQLNYSSVASGSNVSSDVDWTYNVAGNLLTDAYAQVVGSTTGTGRVHLAESLSNGSSLTVTTPNSFTTATFAPTASLTVIMDQLNFSGSDGFAETSKLVNAFSPTTVIPEPSTWALMALGFAGLGLAGWRSRRRSVSIAAA
jgi:hypothetical protein